MDNLDERIIEAEVKMKRANIALEAAEINLSLACQQHRDLIVERYNELSNAL